MTVYRRALAAVVLAVLAAAFSVIALAAPASAAEPPTVPFPIIGGGTEELPIIEIDDHGVVVGPVQLIPRTGPEPAPGPRLLPPLGGGV